MDGYILDLTGVGVEPWLEAIVAGRTPPRTLAQGEIVRALQEILAHWYDNNRLMGSPLAAVLGASTADGLRASVRDTLEARRAQLPPPIALAYRALELAYFTRSSSLERAAENLAVSRSTFYRLLRRGISDLAAVIAHRTGPPTRD
jgi:transcriptional regulator of acetoin/glycerol metabolism